MTDEYEYAVAQAFIGIYGPGALGSGTQSSYDGLSAEALSTSNDDPSCVWGHCFGPMSSSAALAASASFANASASELSGLLQSSAYVQGNSFAAAVPEPATAAMMLAGLAACGFVAGRRRG